jgi:hypothetical protein
MERVRGVLLAASAVVLGLLALAAGLQLAGYGPRQLTAMRGAFGSWYAITSATLVRSVPLIVIGLGIALAFRAGAFNIGAEGRFYAGAIAATWIGLHAAGLPAPLALAAARPAPRRRAAWWRCPSSCASDTASPKSSPRWCSTRGGVAGQPHGPGPLQESRGSIPRAT